MYLGRCSALGSRPPELVDAHRRGRLIRDDRDRDEEDRYQREPVSHQASSTVTTGIARATFWEGDSEEGDVDSTDSEGFFLTQDMEQSLEGMYLGEEEVEEVYLSLEKEKKAERKKRRDAVGRRLKRRSGRTRRTGTSPRKRPPRSRQEQDLRQQEPRRQAEDAD